MDCTGKIQNITKDYMSGQLQITFAINEPSAAQAVNDIKDCEKLSIRAVKYREKRSLDANALLWACLGNIADALRADKWEIYLQMLKRYGKYTHICVKPNVVDAVKAQWRECEVIGEVNINGQKAVQMLCYFGSSTYNTAEMSRIIESVVDDCRELGIPTLSENEIKSLCESYNIE